MEHEDSDDYDDDGRKKLYAQIIESEEIVEDNV